MATQSLFERIQQDTDYTSRYLKIIDDPAVSNVEAAKRLTFGGLQTSEAAVRRIRKDRNYRAAPTPEVTSSDSAAGKRAEEDTTGITVYIDEWPVELGEDLAPLVRFFGYDPEHFEVVDDSVRMSKWQQSKGTDTGGRDVIWLYSYKARFQKILTPLDSVPDLDSVRARVEKFKPRRNVGRPSGPSVVYVHQQGDEQIGKKQGGGLEGVIGRVEDAIEKSCNRLDELKRRGANVVAILDAANGDTIENIFGHYPSQQRTTATLRKQFEVGRELDLTRTRAFAEFELPLHKVYTTDNHGEIRQKIGLAPFTSESDNLALILAEVVKAIVDGTSISDQVTWHIPHDEWWTNLTVAGVNFAVGHGHKATGILEKWVKNQRDLLLMHQDFKPHLMLLGHRHHFMLQDVSGSTLIQTPSLDGGSPFFAALQGNVSRSGVVTYLASTEYNQFFTDLEVI